MIATDVNWIHVELSTRCNAWCPACPRNNQGFGIKDGLVEEDLTTAKFSEIISQFPNLHAVQLCGNYGDPVIAKNFLEIIKIAKQHVNKIQIHTNGSLRSVKWWEKLADELADIDHDVWFGLDGVGKVHEIYRQGTDYDKIISNAAAFIARGGHATWQFIPYAHNEHQIKEALKLSQNLGFKQFKFVKLFRNTVQARHYKTGEEFTLAPPRQFQAMIKLPRVKTSVDSANCMHLSQPSIYVSAAGKLSWCCYFSDDKTFNTAAELFAQSANIAHSTCINNCGN